MFEPTIQNIFGMAIVMVGDLLVITAVVIPTVVLIGILATSLGRVSFAQVIGYWVLSLLLAIFTGMGLVFKAGVPDIASEPNGLIFQFADSLILTLLGVAVLLLIASGGLLVYILNK